MSKHFMNVESSLASVTSWQADIKSFFIYLFIYLFYVFAAAGHPAAEETRTSSGDHLQGKEKAGVAG